jgi:hypothetical protein
LLFQHPLDVGELARVRDHVHARDPAVLHAERQHRNDRALEEGDHARLTVDDLLHQGVARHLSAVTVRANYFADVLGPLVVLAVGLGMCFVSTSVTAISGVKPHESGLASALLNVGRQVGGSLGIAIMGTVATAVARDQLSAGPFTHAAVNRALTAGFSSAFEIAGLIAIAGFITAVASVRHEHARAAATHEVEAEIAA